MHGKEIHLNITSQQKIPKDPHIQKFKSMFFLCNAEYYDWNANKKFYAYDITLDIILFN